MANIDFRDKSTMNYDKFFRTTLFVTKNYSQVKEAYSRMVFNVLSGNQYDHAKNHSFIMNKEGKWSLSPAYDISPTFGYGHQMEINFKDKSVNHKVLLFMADKFEIRDAKDIIQKQVEILSDFDVRAKGIGISQKKIEIILKGFKLFK